MSRWFISQRFHPSDTFRQPQYRSTSRYWCWLCRSIGWYLDPRGSRWSQPACSNDCFQSFFYRKLLLVIFNHLAFSVIAHSCASLCLTLVYRPTIISHITSLSPAGLKVIIFMILFGHRTFSGWTASSGQNDCCSITNRSREWPMLTKPVCLTDFTFTVLLTKNIRGNVVEIIWLTKSSGLTI